MLKRKIHWQSCLMTLSCAFAFLFQPSFSHADSPLLSYKEGVLPILEADCFECHNTKKKKGGLDLTSFHGLLNGGLNGPVIFESKPQVSPLYLSLLEGSDSHMPPKKQLSDESIATIRAWVAGLPENSLSALKGLDIEKLSASGAESKDLKAAVDSLSKWESPPAHLSDSGIIDFYINRQLNEKEIEPAKIADDRTFIRRAYLDLTGEVPTFQEFLNFAANGDQSKRAQLIDRLLENDKYAIHMAEIFDTVLMSRRGESWEKKRKNNKWFHYLEQSFSKNRPWNNVIEEIITARPEKGDHPGAIWFLYEREDNYQAMAEAVAPIAFGTQMKCAQCHDHPLAHEIKQAHYWAMVAAFNRSKNVSTKSGIGISESAMGGEIEFANLKKETQKATLNFLNGIFIDEAVQAGIKEKVDAAEKYISPPVEKGHDVEQPSVPLFSRRSEFAQAVAIKNNFMAARGMVNRVWAHLLGRGLVHPVDEINSFHPASHPQLLEWLSRSYAKNNFDNKWLVKVIMDSETYQRARHSDNLVLQDSSLFAGALEKPVSAESLARSVSKVLIGAEQPPAGLRKKLIQHFPDIFPVEFNATIQQAMFLSNSPEFNGLLNTKNQGLTKKISELSNDTQKVIMAFNSILLRNPDSIELEKSKAFLNSSSESNAKATEYLVWALINSPEFMLNH